MSYDLIKYVIWNYKMNAWMSYNWMKYVIWNYETLKWMHEWVIIVLKI